MPVSRWLVTFLLLSCGWAAVADNAPPPVTFDIPLTDPTTPLFNRRAFTFEIEEEGFYELLAQLTEFPRIFQAWLDDQPLFYVQTRVGVPLSEQPLDARRCCRAVRYFTPGRHTITLWGHYGPWLWDDEMDEVVLPRIRMGLNRLPAHRGAETLAVTIPGRDDMVLRRGQPLTIRLEQATVEGVAAYRMMIRPQRETEVVWSGEAALAAGQRYAAADVSYPCDTEGAFTCTVEDDAGRVVAGPWAFVVIDPTPLQLSRGGDEVAGPRRVLVDEIDCTAAEDAAHRFRDNGASRVVDSPVGRYRVTGDSDLRRTAYIKDEQGWREAQPGEQTPHYYSVADWFAYTMKVKNPGRPHLVVATIPNDKRRLVAVQAIDPMTGQHNGGLLEAGDASAAGPFSELIFLVWPNTDAIDLHIFCSNKNHNSKLDRQGAVAALAIYELPDGLPPLPEADAGWGTGREFGWTGEQTNLGIEKVTTPRLWDDDELVSGHMSPFQWRNGYHDWAALRQAWERFGQFSLYRGDNLFVAPVHTYSMSVIRNAPHLTAGTDPFCDGYRARAEDPFERDQFKMMLLLAEKYRVNLVADLMVTRIKEGYLFATDPSKEHDPTGLFLTGLDGKPTRVGSGAQLLNPAHPLSRRYTVEAIGQIAQRYGAYPAFAGVRIRQWSWGSQLDGWFPSLDAGYDDFTVALFERETGRKVGVSSTGPDRFGQRRDVLLNQLKTPWLKWRAGKVLSLREEMLAELRRHAPRARIYSGHKKLDINTGLDPALLAGKRDLGYGARMEFGGEGVEMNNLDPVCYANFDIREPSSLRRTLQNMTGRTGTWEYPMGLTSGNHSSMRSPPYNLQAPAQALAEGQLQTMFYGGIWVLPQAEEGLRRFTRAFRAIPDLAYDRFTAAGEDDAPVVCWSAPHGRQTVFYVVNTTDQPRAATIRFGSPAASVSDLVSGQSLGAGRTVTLRLAPFMLSVAAAEDAGRVVGVEQR